jgi:hypothetical protein
VVRRRHPCMIIIQKQFPYAIQGSSRGNSECAT